MEKIKIAYTQECLDQLTASLEAQAIAYNEELGKEHPVFETLSKMEDAFKETEADYLAVKTNLVFADCAKADRPMRAAILKHQFPVKKHRLVKEGEKDAAVTVCRIQDVMRPVDLLAFDTKMKGKASHNAQWPHMVTKLTMLLTAGVASSLGLDPKEVNKSFAMADIARQMDMGKTPTSNNALLKQVQSIVDAIIYEENEKTHENVYRASSHDVAYLRELFSKKGKGELSIACAKPAFMRAIMADICNRIVGNRVYAVEYKKADTSTVPAGEVTTVNPATTDAAEGKTAAKGNPQPRTTRKNGSKTGAKNRSKAAATASAK